MQELDFVKQIVASADEKKASRIVVLDLREISDVCSFKIICSGENERQTSAIAESIEVTGKKKFSMQPFGVEGKKTGHWVLLDYGFVVVHVFASYLRDYYSLEEIWPKAKYLSFND